MLDEAIQNVVLWMNANQGAMIGLVLVEIFVLSFRRERG